MCPFACPIGKIDETELQNLILDDRGRGAPLSDVIAGEDFGNREDRENPGHLSTQTTTFDSNFGARVEWKNYGTAKSKSASFD